MQPETSHPSGSRLLDFYRHAGPDTEGRSLHEIRAWNNARLEGVHDYIQWLFPTRQRSAFNASAPSVGAAEIATFQQDAKLRAELVASLRQMLAFYGFDYRENDAGKPVITTGPNWQARSAEWFYAGDHNLLRITRILDCLSTFELTGHAQAFLLALEAACDAAPGTIPSRTRDFWRGAVRVAQS